MEDRYTVDLRTAARLAGVSVPVMREFVKQDGFPAFKAGRRWLIPCDGLRIWLEQQAKERRTMETRTNGRIV